MEGHEHEQVSFGSKVLVLLDGWIPEEWKDTNTSKSVLVVKFLLVTVKTLVPI